MKPRSPDDVIGAPPEELDEAAAPTRILETVVDSFGVDAGDGGGIVVRLEKTKGPS